MTSLGSRERAGLSLGRLTLLIFVGTVGLVELGLRGPLPEYVANVGAPALVVAMLLDWSFRLEYPVVNYSTGLRLLGYLFVFAQSFIVALITRALVIVSTPQPE